MGNIRAGSVLLGIALLSSPSWAQLPIGQSQNNPTPLDPNAINQVPAGQQSSSSIGTSSSLPNCSNAQAGQACIKDSSTLNGSSGDMGGSPVITSGADENDSEITPSGETVRSVNGSPAQLQQNPNQFQQSQQNQYPQSQTQGLQGSSDQNYANSGRQRFYREPPPPPNQFQRFVTNSTGQKLPMFGYKLFENPPSTFAPNTQVPVTGGYVIGPGDQIVIRAWGQIDINFKATVDSSGLIYVPKVGSIEVAGIHYSELQEYLRGKIGRVYRNFELNVTLGRLRSISVLVVGAARHPGNYTISSLSTLVNGIFASGGPAPGGSLRHIELKRNDQVVTDFDLYDLLLRGDKSKDVQLQPGDVIYIAPIGPLVAVSGSVHDAAIYELRGETSLGQLLADAGGLANTADGQRVILERIDDHTVRHMEQFNLDATGLARAVKDGDIVTVFPLNPRFDNAVILRGNVALPGRFPWHEGMRVSDLIPNRNALITPEYWQRLNASATTAAPAPSVTPGANATVTVGGELTSGQAQLRNQIQRTAPEINWEYAVIQRLNPDTLTSTLIPFNLGNAIEGKAASDAVLLPGDVITIFSQADIRVPIEQQSKYVYLEGEINPSGVYKANAGESLRHLVERIGGLTPNAYLYGSRLTRESTRIEQQAKLDRIVEQYSQDIERSAAEKSQNLTNPAEAAVLPAVFDSERRLVERLKAVKATGRIVMNLGPTADVVSALPDITLEDGDRLIVPYRPSTVSVLGAVYNQADFIFSPGRRVADYLQQAGGPTRTGDKKRIYIIRANGSVNGMGGSTLFTAGVLGQRLYPGDTLVVPEQINKTTFKKYLLDYSQILSQFGLGAAAIRVLTP